MDAGRKLWIVLARPDRLHAALVAAQAAGNRFAGGCHLLYEHSTWWERAQWQEYAERFTSVRAFRRVETCRGLRDLPRLYRENIERHRAMAELSIDSRRDVLLTLAGTLSIANAASSAYPSMFKILGIARHMFDELIRPIDRRNFRFTTSGWFQNRIVEPLAGVERTVNLRPRFRRGGDGVRVSRFLRGIEQIYDVSIVMSNSGRDRPAREGSAILPARFPSIADLHDRKGGARDLAEKRVVFFGTPFLLIRNLKPEVYIERLNNCLDYLRRNYPANCCLIYRPHPAEKNEASRLDLQRFEIEDDREAAELYFLRHYLAIEAVYSVSSTVSRVALNNGLDAYSFWRCFNFPTTAAAFFESVMGDVPPGFDVRDLAIPPVRYQEEHAPRDRGESFSKALNRALDLHLA